MLTGAIGAELDKMPGPGAYESFGRRGRETVGIDQICDESSSRTTITHTKREGIKTEAELTEDGELYLSESERQWSVILAAMKPEGISDITIKVQQDSKTKKITNLERTTWTKNKILRTSEPEQRSYIYDSPEQISILGLAKVLKSMRKARKVAERAQKNQGNL